MDTIRLQSFDSDILFALVTLLLVAPAITKHSPFDAPKAHQEIVGGVEVEYGGMLYELVYMAKFLEYIFIYSLIFFTAGANTLLGLVFVVFAFLLLNAIDNATARITLKNMLQVMLGLGVVLSLCGIIWSQI